MAGGAAQGTTVRGVRMVAGGLLWPVLGAVLLMAACSADPAGEDMPTPATPEQASSTAPMTPAEARVDAGEIAANGCYGDRDQTTAPDVEACAYGDPEGDTVVLYGDSHAAQWFEPARRVAEDQGWRLLPVTKMACPPGDVPVRNARLDRAYTECAAWHEEAMRLIVEQEPVRVLVATRAGYYRVVRDGEPLPVAESADLLGEALARDLATFAELGAETVLIRDTPVPGFNVPDCIEAEGPDACTYPFDASLPDDSAQVRAARQTRTTVVDLNQDVCGDPPTCRTLIDGLITFRDDDHVAATFAGTLADRLKAGILSSPA